jgi:hypothetical protein
LSSSANSRSTCGDRSSSIVNLQGHRIVAVRVRNGTVLILRARRVRSAQRIVNSPHRGYVSASSGVANIPSENGYVSADGGVAVFNSSLIVTMCPRTATQLNRLEAVCATCGVEISGNHPLNRSNRGYVRKLRHRIRRSIPTSNFFKFPPHRIVAVRANCGIEFVGASRHRSSSSFFSIPCEIVESSSASRR